MKIAISITCHEQPDVIFNQCLNIVTLLADPVIVIHFNQDNLDVKNDFEKLIAFRAPLSTKKRIVLNPVSHRTGKDTFSLHKAHISNLSFIREEMISFDYFLLEASNCLFVRKGLENHISQHDLGIGLGGVSGYWKERIESHVALADYAEKVSDIMARMYHS